jgi:hypothetical protein
MKKTGKVLLATLALALIPTGLSAASTTKVGTTQQWAAWARIGKPAVTQVVKAYNQVQGAVAIGNVAGAEAGFISFSNAAVKLAAIDDSPGPKTNAQILICAEASNVWAWLGYQALAVNGPVAQFRAETLVVTNDYNELTTLMGAKQ